MYTSTSVWRPPPPPHPAHARAPLLCTRGHVRAPWRRSVGHRRAHARHEGPQPARGARVFVVSLCSGILASTVAATIAGFRVAGVAFSETAGRCRAVIFAQIPDAIDLGDLRAIDGTRFKRLFQEWRKSFDVVLGEAGSPCQDFTVLSAKRRGLEGS